MEEKDTEELLAIWEANDRSAYGEEVFSVIRTILLERGVTPNQQRSPKASDPKSARRSSEENGFLSFRTMVSGAIIKVLYAVVAAAITIAGIMMIVSGLQEDRLLEGAGAGLALLVVGNLLWRLICEGLILLFSIHEVLVSIERKLP